MVDFVSQKIKALITTTKFAAEISNIFQKDFVYFSLDNKKSSFL